MAGYVPFRSVIAAPLRSTIAFVRHEVRVAHRGAVALALYRPSSGDAVPERAGRTPAPPHDGLRHIRAGPAFRGETHSHAGHSGSPRVSEAQRNAPRGASLTVDARTMRSRRSAGIGCEPAPSCARGHLLVRVLLHGDLAKLSTPQAPRVSPRPAGTFLQLASPGETSIHA